MRERKNAFVCFEKDGQSPARATLAFIRDQEYFLATLTGKIIPRAVKFTAKRSKLKGRLKVTITLA